MEVTYIHPIFFKNRLYNKRILNVSQFRNSTIINKLIGLKMHVYNGLWLLTKIIDERMLKYKIGSFSITKKFDGQTQKKRKTKRKTKKNR